MERQNTIRNFIIENFLFGDTDNLNDNTDLFKESIIDSTGILELIAFIEMSFNIRIEDNEMIQENFQTVTSITNFINDKIVKQKNTICAD